MNRKQDQNAYFGGAQYSRYANMQQRTELFTMTFLKMTKQDKKQFILKSYSECQSN